MSAGMPFSEWTEGAPLANWREIQFGTYVFPLTGQEKSRDLKLGQDRKKIPGGIGDFIAIESSLTGREVEVVAAVGSQMIGSQGNTILTQDDLEQERALLAGLQTQGRQALYVRPDRFLNAYLTDFEFAFFQDSGAYRYANFTIKFVADDPRYFSVNKNDQTLGAYTDTQTYSTPVSHNGNTRSYPIITIAGACTSPTVGIFQGSNGVQVTFSQLTMYEGDTLVINCDPRPEYRDNPVTYTPNGGVAVPGLRYCQVSDFQNTLNVEEWFPYIEATAFQSGTQTFQVSSTANGNYTVNLTWRDVWI